MQLLLHMYLTHWQDVIQNQGHLRKAQGSMLICSALWHGSEEKQLTESLNVAAIAHGDVHWAALIDSEVLHQQQRLQLTLSLFQHSSILFVLGVDKAKQNNANGANKPVLCSKIS